MDFNRKIITLVLVTIGVSMVHSACICHESELPIWKAPCGKNITDEDFDVSDLPTNSKEKKLLIMKSLRNIKQNLRLCIHFYAHHNYTKKSYELVQKSLNIFNDDWLPTSKSVQNIKIDHVKQIPKVELIMYSTLQKYAMMFKLIIDDDSDKEKQKYAKTVTENLKSLLCEVQTSLIFLNEKPRDTPEEIPQQYLSIERYFTHLRDHHVIWKFGQLLREWRQWIKNVRKQFGKNKKNRKNSKN